MLTTFVLGLFAWQRSAMEDMEGQRVADSISDMLDCVGSIEAATVLNISFGREQGQLPETIGGEAYTINITRDSVIVTADGSVWMSKLVADVIPQNLSTRSYNMTEYGAIEYHSWTGEHTSSGSFFMERAEVDVSGEKRYVTLVYWE